MQEKGRPETMSESLETRLTANPGSMAFARLASLYLRQGNVQDALQLCVEGVKKFPRYGTGHLILGRCYETLGRNVEAMLEYRKALRSIPNNTALKQVLAAVEKKEEEAFRRFEEERARKIEPHRDTLSAHSYVMGKGPEATSRTEGPPKSTARIVTPTLAEIYANQGEYEEAIAAYKKLMEQRPVDAARYSQRLSELEELMRIQQTERSHKRRDEEE